MYFSLSVIIICLISSAIGHALPDFGLNVIHVTSQIKASGGDSAQTPSQCNNACAPVVSTISQCMTPQCICTASNVNGVNTCIRCIADAGGDVSEVEASLNELVTECKAAGFNVPPATSISPIQTTAITTASAITTDHRSQPDTTDNVSQPDTTDLDISTSESDFSTSVPDESQTSSFKSTVPAFTVQSQPTSSTADGAQSTNPSSGNSGSSPIRPGMMWVQMAVASGASLLLFI